MTKYRLLLALTGVGLLAVVSVGFVGASAWSAIGPGQSGLADFPSEPDDHDLATLRRYYETIPVAWPAPHLDPSVEYADIEPFDVVKSKAGISEAKAALGKRLFEDPILSASGQISCQSCHNRQLGWGDGLQNSFGHDRAQGKRNATPLFNAALRKTLFWDGRARTLDEQAVDPLTNPVEMANTDLVGLVARLEADPDYPALFEAAFGTRAISTPAVLQALTAFQSTLEERTRFDRFIAGQRAALTDQQVFGLHIFRTKGGCVNCHNGPLLTDEKFHNLGLSLVGRPREDIGRYGVTGATEDVGRFRTPSLRHVGTSAPYMHNGIVPSLRHAVLLYQTGGGRTRARPGNAKDAAHPLMEFAGQTSSILKPLGLSQAERDALVAFLESL